MERAWGELREVAEDMVKLVGRLGKVGWATMLHWEIKDRRRLRRLCLYYSDYHFKFIYLMLSMSLEQQRRGWRLGGLPLATHIFALPYLGWEMPLPSSLGGGNIFFYVWAERNNKPCLPRETKALATPLQWSHSQLTFHFQGIYLIITVVVNSLSPCHLFRYIDLMLIISFSTFQLIFHFKRTWWLIYH